MSPLAPALLKVTGISHKSPAALITESGDITRFAASAKLARYTGCAPIAVYSADQKRVGCTAAATTGSTVSSTPPRSCRNADTQPRKHSWSATNPPKARAEPAASSNATPSTS
ncbi:transposase [Kutzneria buriramensis]|uniref:Transposase IS116/IS110/IS902 family protein n=1 Tax=Kutzneria buriramensis TaxID=1045776 RepID=A0A3E0GTV5_9PSEU|nr:transposase IS116/IS110/IS902 family protein [Kutzneria buriramensis]